MRRNNPTPRRLFTLAGLAAAVCLAAPVAADVLVYNDGDRLQGRLVSDDGETIVFVSPRFGELRVPAAQAKAQRDPSTELAQAPVLPGESVSSVAPAAPSAASGKPEHTARAEQRAEINELSRALHKFFGPWHGRLAASTELEGGDKEKHNSLIEGRLGRKWARNELRMEASYEFKSSDGKTDTNLLKNSAYWKHELTPRWFAIAQPRLEWNQYYKKDKQIIRYFLIHQELGVGALLINSKKGKLSSGLSGNVYDLWTLSAPQHHYSKFAPGAFLEAEFNLRWGLRLTERAVRYFSFDDSDPGWESEFELSKKLTETLTLALRHDVRLHDPDFRLENSSTWRMLLGFDF